MCDRQRDRKFEGFGADRDDQVKARAKRTDGSSIATLASQVDHGESRAILHIQPVGESVVELAIRYTRKHSGDEAKVSKTVGDDEDVMETGDRKVHSGGLRIVSGDRILEGRNGRRV